MSAPEDTSPAWQALGRKLRLKRQLIGIRLSELAELVGVERALLLAVEEGRYDLRSLPLPAQERLAHWLDA